MKWGFLLPILLGIFSCTTGPQSRMVSYTPHDMSSPLRVSYPYPESPLPQRVGILTKNLAALSNSTNPDPVSIDLLPESGKAITSSCPIRLAPPHPAIPFQAIPVIWEKPVFQNVAEVKAESKMTSPAVSKPSPPVKTGTLSTEKKLSEVSPVPEARTMASKGSSTVPLAPASLLPGAAPRQSDLKFEEVNAKTGDDVYLQFSKLNWVYVDAKENQKTVGFIESRRERDGTSFLFRPKKSGEFDLEFSRQDLAGGVSESRRIRLHVIDPEKKADPQTGNLFTDSSADKNRITGSLLIKKGQLPEAAQKLLLNYSNDDTKTNLELGKLLAQSGQDEEALKYLDRNLGHASTEFQDSLILATQTALKSNLKGRLAVYMPFWKLHKLIPPEDLFLDVFEAESYSDEDQAINWADSYDTWYPIPQKRDRYLYLKAELMEKPGSHRDVRQSWTLYNQVIQDYPLSAWWEKAGERASYINRHFLQAR